MDRSNDTSTRAYKRKINVVAIIPARYASTRFPGKPLVLIEGKPMIERVYRLVAPLVDDVAVATDDIRIVDAVEAFGGKAVLTSKGHTSGTSRVWEAYCKLGLRADVVVNVQGDEPFMPQENIMRLIGAFSCSDTQIATLIYRFKSSDGIDVLADPNRPKVVVGTDGYAKYFSRAVIPYVRGVPMERWPEVADYYLHQGIYGFTPEALKSAVSLPPSSLEKAECLEQLTWLAAGLNICAVETQAISRGIDTPEDLLSISLP